MTDLPKAYTPRDVEGAIYERWIRETPSQWAWHQERWRTQPGEHDAVPLVEHERRSRAMRRKDLR